MFKIILIIVVSFVFGAMTVVLFAMMKVSSECSRKEEKLHYLNLGKDYYNFVEKMEDEKSSSKRNS